jgi:DNA-binding PadR family transcriptional regulator
MYSFGVSVAYALLGILGRQASYGYDLKKDYDRYYGKQKPLAFGQVYATLSRLLRDEKIATQGSIEPSKGPERRLYAITELGRRELEAWLTTPEEQRPTTQTVLFTKVVTAILLEKDPDAYLDAQRSAHIQRMRELTTLRRESDSLSEWLTADYALFHLEADLRWMDVTLGRLQALAKEIRRER